MTQTTTLASLLQNCLLGEGWRDTSELPKNSKRVLLMLISDNALDWVNEDEFKDMVSFSVGWYSDDWYSEGRTMSLKSHGYTTAAWRELPPAFV